MEKLIQLTPESDSEREVLTNQPSIPYQMSNQNVMMQPHGAYDNVNVRSRLPPRNASEVSSPLPVLSPKTPAPVTINYPETFSTSVQQHVQPGLKALNSYGMNFNPNEGASFKAPFSQVVNNPNFTVPHQEEISSVSQMGGPGMYNSFGLDSPGHSNFTTSVTSTNQLPIQLNSTTKHSFMPQNAPNNSSFMTVAKTQSGDTFVSPSVPKSASEAKAQKEPVKLGTTHHEQKLLAKKRGRKTTMSLNPEEREALETLVGDVIIEGIGDGVIDSGESSSSSSESDEDTKPQTETSSSDVQKEDASTSSDYKAPKSKKDPNESQKLKVAKEKQKGFEQGQKVYPPQLKVAVKHMKNLPPRFLRKIQPNKDEKQVGETEKGRSVREKPIPEVVEPKEIKIEKKREDQQILTSKEKERAIRSKEERMLENKKKVKGMLLEGLDNYLEQSVDSDEKKHSEDPSSDKEGTHPSLKKEALNEPFSHSAPSSAQVSPNVHLNMTPQKANVDLGPVDPAIKAQGPTIVPQIRPNLPVQPQSIMAQPRFIGPPKPGVVMNQPPAPVYLQNAAVNCAELEREMFKAGDNGKEQQIVATVAASLPSELQQNLQQISISSLTKNAHLMQSHQYRAQLHQQQQLQNNKSQFSVDAPEFIPRTFTPGTSGVAPGHMIRHEMLPSQATQFPPPIAVNISKPMGRASPHVSTTVSSSLTPVGVIPQELLVSPSVAHPNPANMGRNSPIPPPPPGVPANQAYILPKVQQSVMAAGSPHSAPVGPTPPQPQPPPPAAGQAPPPPGPGMGLVYTPVAAPYPHPQFRPAAYPQYQLQGPFLVQAWSGGRKTHTNPLHPSHPASHQKTNGMGHRGRSGITPSKAGSLHSHVGVTQKLPHRGQHEMSPQQAKEKVDALMKQGKKVLVILRGLPGSGKSTIAK